jgi:pimeloyl-ACP methyl ester carboxylesterase
VVVGGIGLPNHQNWLNKPDGGEGWASKYLGAEHTVYIVDQVNRGRSPTAPGLPQEVWTTDNLAFAFTAAHLHNVWPHSNLHSQWPGTGLLGDPIFEAYYATVTPSDPNFGLQEDRMREPMRQLAEKVDEEFILLTHSQGGFLGWVMADIVGRKRIRAIVCIEPVGPTFEESRMFGAENPKPRLWGITNTSLTFDPPVTDPKVDFKIKRDGEPPLGCLLQDDAYPIRKLKHLADIPILVVTAEASFSRHWDPCTVAFLRQAGVQVEWFKLWEHGIKGNGHMMFLEKNSDEIWKLINGWISRLGENQGGKGPDITHGEL